PTELIDAKKQKPKDRCTDKSFRRKALGSTDSDFREDTENVGHDNLLLKDRESLPLARRRRLKALCYKDILIIIICHLVTSQPVPAMAVKFIHYKGANNKPKP
ncbi:hypothetical protein LZ30DRAFT_608622, partial [Colletotrichum cereale]